MRYKLFSQLLFVALVVACSNVVFARVQEQQPQPTPASPDEGIVTRGAFLTTRPKTPGKTASAEAGAALSAGTPDKKTDATVAANNTPGNPKKSITKSSVNNKPKKSVKKGTGDNAREESADADEKTTGRDTGGASAEAALKLRPIGLGYTLFTLGDNGEAVRTDPARQFRTGEAIRLALETNTDGYLYIFHTENDGEASMIFPDARLSGGNNLVKAHVPFEIPSSQGATDDMRWFVFRDPPAAERLYVVLARQPLAGVPTGAALSDYCFDAQHTCPWHPATAMWAELKSAQEREQVAVSKVKDQGRTQTSDEREATTRGLGLAAGAPQPSIIRMTATSDSKMLVTAIDLIHK
ncbi:MAG TPA: DUF4384 domain-containing protein [Pyrinomonadaceae bacterium]|nr:DUF4384 domain-containing protein [Pyrinomonadaceae bacterium]